MKVHSFAIAALCAAVVVEASSPHHLRTVNSRHARLARRDGAKRCRNRTPPSPPPQNLTGIQGQNQDQNKDQSQSQDQSQNQNQNQNQNQDQNKDQNQNQGPNNNNDNSTNNNNNNDNDNTNTSNNNNSNQGGSTDGAIAGLLNVASSCGPIGATKDITGTSGPNGDIGWLNCGIDGSGWHPSMVGLADLKFQDLSEATKVDSSPFKACQDFIDMFYKSANELGLPPILLASFAMQESTCNPSTTGGAGEAGLMQLTHDKCGDAPGGNCYDPEYNIRTGAEYFHKILGENNGNVLQAMGTYNGWYLGMTLGSATAAANGPCCRCQNNLDYLQQMVNGWLQNIDPYVERWQTVEYLEWASHEI